MMDIDLSIDRLVLHGINIPRGQRPLLKAAVETELRRLLTEGDLASLLTGGGVQPNLLGGEITLSSGDTTPDPVHLGVQIAQAVYGGISR